MQVVPMCTGTLVLAPKVYANSAGMVPSHGILSVLFQSSSYRNSLHTSFLEKIPLPSWSHRSVLDDILSHSYKRMVSKLS